MTPAAIALLVFYMAISIADILTTERVIRKGGREANPVMRWLMEQLGRGGAYAVKMVVALGVGIVGAVLAPPALVLLNAMGCWVVWHNWRVVK